MYFLNIRTQTPGKVHTNTRSTKKTSTKTSSPDPVEQRKSSKYNRSPSPAKPSSPVPQETKRSAKRSPSPAPATPSSRGPGKRLKTTRHGSSSPDLEVNLLKIWTASREKLYQVTAKEWSPWSACSRLIRAFMFSAVDGSGFVAAMWRQPMLWSDCTDHRLILLWLHIL